MGDMRSITSIFLKILLLACCDNVSAGKEVFHSHAKRSLKGYTRFGYQNPIFVAPTLPPSLTYERESQDKMPNLSKEEPEESRPTMYAHVFLIIIICGCGLILDQLIIFALIRAGYFMKLRTRRKDYNMVTNNRFPGGHGGGVPHLLNMFTRC